MIRTVTRGPWGAGSTSGTGIDGHIVNVYRCIDGNKFKDGKFRIMNGQLDGLTLQTREEVNALQLLYGYIQPYSRNSVHFVMTRAARKRGYTTTDWMYTSRQQRHNQPA